MKESSGEDGSVRDTFTRDQRAGGNTELLKKISIDIVCSLNRGELEHGAFDLLPLYPSAYIFAGIRARESSFFNARRMRERSFDEASSPSCFATRKLGE